MNAIERAIQSVAPGWAARRAKARVQSLAYNEYARHFEGAAKTDRTSGGWTRTGSGPASMTRGQLSTLRQRSRYLTNNNPWATRGVDWLEGQIVGPGIIPVIEARTDRATQNLRALWADHMETTAVDADGLNDIYGLQALAAREVIEAGDVLIRRRGRRSSDGLPLPFQLQVLEGDHLDTSMDGIYRDNGNLVIQGVEFNRIGRRVAYWLFPNHPSDGVAMQRYQSQRVPAEEIIHLFKVHRAGQVRGIPRVAPIIIRLRDFDEFDDATLMRQKVAASFAGFVQDMEAPDDVSGGKKNADLYDSIEPGTIEILPPGKTITFPTPPGVESYRDFSYGQLLAISAGLGVPYEALTKDMSKTNFISGRMGRMDSHRETDAFQRRVMNVRMNQPVFSWFREAAAVAGFGTQPARSKWTPPKRDLVDPGREIPMFRDAVRSTLISLPDAHRQLGQNSDEVLDEVESSNRGLDRRRIVSDADPRKTSRAGGVQAELPPDYDGSGQGDDE
ncbi:MAG: phage portal protein [Thiohalorhabdus sp.]